MDPLIYKVLRRCCVNSVRHGCKFEPSKLCSESLKDAAAFKTLYVFKKVSYRPSLTFFVFLTLYKRHTNSSNISKAGLQVSTFCESVRPRATARRYHAPVIGGVFTRCCITTVF
jgi:hypothetical protein